MSQSESRECTSNTRRLETSRYTAVGIPRMVVRRPFRERQYTRGLDMIPITCTLRIPVHGVIVVHRVGKISVFLTSEDLGLQ